MELISTNYHVQLLVVTCPILYKLIKAYKDEGKVTTDKDILINLVTDYDDVINTPGTNVIPFSRMTYDEINKTIAKL